jgi:hypothetical protein
MANVFVLLYGVLMLGGGVIVSALLIRHMLHTKAKSHTTPEEAAQKTYYLLEIQRVQRRDIRINSDSYEGRKEDKRRAVPARVRSSSHHRSP